MIKSALAILFVSLAITATANAKMYRCTLLDGTVIYGDKPVYESDEYCSEVDETGPQNTYKQPPQKKRVYTGPRTGPTRLIKPANPVQPAAKKPAQAPQPSIPEFDQTKEEATSLVEDYQTARKKRYMESLQTDVQQAMREMQAIKEDKETLLSGLDRKGLSWTQRNEIRSILEEIPE